MECVEKIQTWRRCRIFWCTRRRGYPCTRTGHGKWEPLIRDLRFTPQSLDYPMRRPALLPRGRLRQTRTNYHNRDTAGARAVHYMIGMTSKSTNAGAPDDPERRFGGSNLGPQLSCFSASGTTRDKRPHIAFSGTGGVQNGELIGVNLDGRALRELDAKDPGVESWSGTRTL